jgi:hypothetical protein
MLAFKTSGEKGLMLFLCFSAFLLLSRNDLQLPSVSDAEAGPYRRL